MFAREPVAAFAITRASEIKGGSSFMWPARSASLNQIQLTPNMAANCAKDSTSHCSRSRATAALDRANRLGALVTNGSTSGKDMDRSSRLLDATVPVRSSCIRCSIGQYPGGGLTDCGFAWRHPHAGQGSSARRASLPRVKGVWQRAQQVSSGTSCTAQCRATGH